MKLDQFPLPDSPDARWSLQVILAWAAARLRDDTDGARELARVINEEVPLRSALSGHSYALLVLVCALDRKTDAQAFIRNAAAQVAAQVEQEAS